MIFVEAFLECVIHGIDGGLALLIATHGIDVGFLNEKENKEKRCKSCDNDDFDYGKAFFWFHAFIIP